MFEIDIDKDNLTKNREGYLFVYLQITFNQFRRFANLEQFGKSGKGWRKFTVNFELESEFLECKILAVLSTALFFEAYIFDYCARKESAKFAQKYLDKLDPIAKWIVGTRLFCPPGIDQGDEVMERFKKLISLRNNLVHHKTKEGDSFDQPPPFPEDISPFYCIKLIIDFLKILKELDNSEVFADFALNHINSWFTYTAKDKEFYPILWEA